MKIVVKDARELEIDKTDMGGEVITTSDATFILSGDDLTGVTAGGQTVGEDGKITFTGNDTTIIGLKDGTYTLHEEVAPNGYLAISDFTFTVTGGVVTVDADQTFTNGEAEMVDGVLTIMDERNSIQISKRDFADAETVLEATFELTVAEGEGNTASLDGVTAGTATAVDGVITFTGADTIITGLTDGTYTLKETAGPDGYQVVSEFTFVIVDGKVDTNETVTVTGGEVELKEDQIIVKDKKSEITVSKRDLNAASDTAVSATFKLTGTNLGGVEIGTDNALADDTTEVTFTGADTIITGLKDGTYTLEETAVTGNYATVSVFEFTIKDGKLAVSAEFSFALVGAEA